MRNQKLFNPIGTFKSAFLQITEVFMLKECFDSVREISPLIHSITNYVTVNDVANAILAAGASPVMSDEPEDVEDIVSICSALNINIGTLNKSSIKAMFLAGKKAADLNRAVILDPVGAGASSLRTSTALALMKEIPFTVIRGNSSEIKTLAAGSGLTNGVDANSADAISEKNLEEGIAFAKQFAQKNSCIAAITGAIDLVADKERCFVIRNGRAEMSRITGTGCCLSGIMAAFVSANKNTLEAAAAAVCAMGLAGETGWIRMQSGDGNATYRNRIIDALYCMTGDDLEKGARYEIR